MSISTFLIKNDYLDSEKKNSLNTKSLKKWLILDSETKLILILENISTKNSRKVLTAKSNLILTILLWIWKWVN